jgi:L-fucose mutarotase/ribose pyranase (RbsD/FucU family)
MIHLKNSSIAAVLACVFIGVSGCSTPNWQSRLDTVLPEYGHRNWIVIADAAYPKQSAPGIETIATGMDQFEVLEAVLAAVDAAPHVQPIVMLDAELEHVVPEDAPGVAEYRARLKEVLKDRPVQVNPHEEIIAKLDADSEMYNVLLLKTDLVIPYTSVFLQLDCGYWNAEKEARLRDLISRQK